MQLWKNSSLRGHVTSARQLDLKASYPVQGLGMCLRIRYSQGHTHTLRWRTSIQRGLRYNMALKWEVFLFCEFGLNINIGNKLGLNDIILVTWKFEWDNACHESNHKAWSSKKLERKQTLLHRGHRYNMDWRRKEYAKKICVIARLWWPIGPW